MVKATHAGFTISYEVRGEGDPLILLHGNTGASRMLDAEIEYYSRSFQVIAIDLIGHGLSDRLPDWPVDFWVANARVALALCAHLNCPPVHVIGTSGGAVVALNMALECPARVRSVIADSFVGRRLSEGDVQRIAREREAARTGPGRGFWASMHGSDWEAVVDADTRMLRRCLDAGGEFFPRGLDSLQCPVLLTASAGDELIPHASETLEDLAGEIPDVECKLFESGGHPAMLSNREQFRSLALSFLGRCATLRSVPPDVPAFEEQVACQVQRLRNESLRAIEQQTIAKRNAWWDEHAGACPGSATPRMAFEALFFEYMGLDPANLPVLHEDENEIAWASKNPCPTLEACRRLGLDTRVVCREVYEKSTQAFISRIDPELRFLRDYGKIRPFADHCLERIVRVPFEARMHLAIEEARRSRREGNKGYGAVAVLGDRELAHGHDATVTGRDPSLHAEMNVLRQAVRVLGSANLSGVVLFSTCEPCPMCSSMAVWSNVSAIVFGASSAETAARGKLRILIPAAQVVAMSPARIEVFPGVLRKECLELYR